jgi:hypothetical protein
MNTSTVHKPKLDLTRIQVWPEKYVEIMHPGTYLVERVERLPPDRPRSRIPRGVIARGDPNGMKERDPFATDINHYVSAINGAARRLGLVRDLSPRDLADAQAKYRNDFPVGAYDGANEEWAAWKVGAIGFSASLIFIRPEDFLGWVGEETSTAPDDEAVRKAGALIEGAEGAWLARLRWQDEAWRIYPSAELARFGLLLRALELIDEQRQREAKEAQRMAEAAMKNDGDLEDTALKQEVARRAAKNVDDARRGAGKN